GIAELVAQTLFGRIDHQPGVHVEHQVGDLDKAPQPAAVHAPRVQLVDLAVVEEADLVERFGHGIRWRKMGWATAVKRAGPEGEGAPGAWQVTPARRRSPSIPLQPPQPLGDGAARGDREHEPEPEDR